MKKILLATTLFFVYFSIFSQSITAKLIDEKNGNSIPFANIKTGEYSGVISNDEGYFTINTEEGVLKSITISCLGYENKTLSFQDIKALNYVIGLEVAVNQLDEVFISNKRPNADSIIAKVKSNLAINYSTELNEYNVFRRTTDYVDFKSLDFEIEKASHVIKKNIEDANGSLTAMAKQIKESNIVSFSDFKGTLYAFNKDSSKINVEKATKLLDHENDFSIDNIEEKAKAIVLTYLDTTKTYKLKTGIFKIEDSLSLKSKNFKDEERNHYNLANLNSSTRSLLRRSQFYKNSFLNSLLNIEYYEYNFEDLGYNNGELTYIISFSPRKGKAKYAGKLYVADDTYAITRADYSYYKNRRGKKLNLRLILGVKYIENLSEGTIIFEKDSSKIYHPKYIKRASGSYFYVSRELKFIENSGKHNKVRFDFTLEGDQRDQEELLITSNKKLGSEDFEAIKQVEKILITKLNTYQKTLWENEAIIEPTLQMKAFKVED